MVTEPILAGQLVTVAAQEVMVYVVVLYTVEVVYAVTDGEEVGYPPAVWVAGVVVGYPFPVSVAVTGHTVV